MSSAIPFPVPSFSLSGGLPVIACSRPGPEILAARLVIRGGSGADPLHRRGAHQLLAGTMTRGCGHLDADALADLVEGAGAALRAEAAGEPRITLTAPVLKAAMNIHILITGAEKRAAIERAAHLPPHEAPVRAVLSHATVHWAE